jgi:hypothetical protein
MTILSALKEAAVLCGLPEPTAIIASTTETDRVFLSLARLKSFPARLPWWAE